MPKKLIVLGIDGADWKIIDALISEGELPNFQKVMKGGSHARLRSTIPPLTAPAWTSMFTGVNPGKHGIFDFAMLTEGKRKYTSGSDRLVPYFWDLMHRHKVIAYNIPCSYPPRASDNTLLVSGYCTPGPEAEFTSPSSLKKEILGLVPDYEFNPGAESNLINLGASGDKSKIGDSIVKSLKGRMKVSSHLLDTKDWEVAFVVFSETDWIQHYFMYEFVTSKSKSSTEIGQIYRSIDSFLGELLEKKLNILIVSDHGFKLVNRLFFMNSFLMRRGILKLKKTSRNTLMQRMGITRNKVLSIVPAWLFSKIQKFELLANMGRKLFPSWALTEGMIDLKTSKAYLFSNSGGVVVTQPLLIEEVIQEVKNARDEAGRVPVSSVHRCDQIYHGEAVSRAPHLVSLPGEDTSLSIAMSKSLSKDVDPFSERSGYHDMFGVFLSTGPDFKSMGKMNDLDLLDIAPTVLSLFGYPPPVFMDGKLIGILEENITSKRNGLKSNTLLAIKKLAMRKQAVQESKGAR